MNQCQEHKIEALSEQLGVLRITKENTLEEITEYINKMLIAPANIQNKQAGLPKSIVPDPG